MSRKRTGTSLPPPFPKRISLLPEQTTGRKKYPCEGFLRFFEERLLRQDIYFLNEPESALSPKRKLQLLRLLSRIQTQGRAQVIMATVSPLLMALPEAQGPEICKGGLAAVDYRQTRHFKLYQAFTADPGGFIHDAIADEDSGLS